MTFEKLRGLTVVVLGMQIGQGSLKPVGNNKQQSKKFETLNKTEYPSLSTTSIMDCQLLCQKLVK